MGNNVRTDIGKGNWRVKVIDCGTHWNYKGNLTAGYDDELFMHLPYLAFLLQNGEMNVLIDNGINERFLIDGKAWGGCPVKNADSTQFLKALREAGVEPGDIDLLIYTHLHNDHAGNANLFPATRSIAQKDEWYNILNTVFAERQRRDFDLDVIPYIANNPNFFRVDGDCDILEGIRVIKTPGHTRGSQSVVVNTVNGLRVFVGDQFHLPCSCFPWMTEMMDCDGKMNTITPAPSDWPTMPSKLVYNYYAYYESAEKIKATIPVLHPAYVVCGHDPALLFNEV